MKIEEIRLTPEEIADVKKEVLGYYVYPASERKFIIDKAIANTATDKAIKKIIEYIKQNNSGGVSYGLKSGEHGYGTSHIRFNEIAWQALKRMVKEE